jgi:hypothetical protein
VPDDDEPSSGSEEEYDAPPGPPEDYHDPMQVPEIPEDERDDRIHTGRIYEDVRED